MLVNIYKQISSASVSFRFPKWYVQCPFASQTRKLKSICRRWADNRHHPNGSRRNELARESSTTELQSGICTTNKYFALFFLFSVFRVDRSIPPGLPLSPMSWRRLRPGGFIFGGKLSIVLPPPFPCIVFLIGSSYLLSRQITPFVRCFNPAVLWTKRGGVAPVVRCLFSCKNFLQKYTLLINLGFCVCLFVFFTMLPHSQVAVNYDQCMHLFYEGHLSEPLFLANCLKYSATSFKQIFTSFQSSKISFP